jgi:2,3-dihydroxybiphenyl 1,2-dioxygenase
LGLVRFLDPNGIPSELYYGPLVRFEERFTSPRVIEGFEAGELGLGHIVISVEDLRESLRFYRDLLGMRVSDFIRLDVGSGRRVTVAFLRCNPRHHSVALVPMSSAKRLQHFMVQVRSIDDVGATYYLCQERGATTSSLRRHTNDHMLSFYVRSPSGFEVEYGWGGRLVDERTWQVQYHERSIIWGRPHDVPGD